MVLSRDLCRTRLMTDPCQLYVRKARGLRQARTSQLLASVNPSLTQLVRAEGDPYEGQTL